MKRLILIRHGETPYSAAKRYCGFQDVSLNRTGIKQSRRIGNRLKKIKIDEIYSSDLKRCLETARIAFKNKKIHVRKDLREINFGALSGLRYGDLKRKYPKIYNLWARRPERLKMPRGESLAGFAKRVKRSLSGIIRENPDKTVAVVTHGGVTRIMLLKLLGKRLNKMWEIEQSAAAINVIKFVRGKPRVLKVNEISHLR